MVEPKRSTKLQSNVNGKILKLNVNSLGAIVNVSILASNNASLFRNTLELITIVLINLIALYLHIITFQIGVTIFVCTLVWWFTLLKSVKEENLIVIKHLGIQFTTVCVVGKKTTFIPYEQVQNIFINEVIFRNKVIYFLTLITKDASYKTNLVPLFANSMPRLKCLQEIYRQLKLLMRTDSNEVNKNLKVEI